MKKAGLRKQGQEHLESVLEGMCVCEAVHGALRAQEGAEVHFQRNENGVNVERDAMACLLAIWMGLTTLVSLRVGFQVSCKAARRSSTKLHLPPQTGLSWWTYPFSQGAKKPQCSLSHS